MAVGYDIDLDLRSFDKMVRGIEKQVPFALSLALNSTAFSVRKHIVEDVYPASFDVKNKAFPRAAFRVRKSTKRNLRARVFDRLDKPFLQTQILGGPKYPVSSPNLAVPVNVSRRRSSARASRTGPNIFVKDFGRGKGPAIWRRMGRGGRRLRLLYELEPKVNIQRAFPFYAEARREANRVFPEHFRNGLKRAISTAR